MGPDEFLGLLENRQGAVARPNGTFFSLNVVTTALQRIRLDLLRGARLTEKGEHFVAGAAGLLARLTQVGARRRGLKVDARGSHEGAADGFPTTLVLSRTRDGMQEEYCQDFLQDTHELLLRPPQAFPSIQGRVYMVESLVYPSPEYLYLYGVFLLQSPRATGNWPRTRQVGGLEQDFDQSKNLLVDDLHKDCGLPADDARLRALSWWVVFPPYGWDMNGAQEYNMMTLVDQIARRPIVPLETGLHYLRALLKSQLVFIRSLAARTLLLLGETPRDLHESTCFIQALNANDQQLASGSMVQFQWALAGHDPQSSPPPDWPQQCAGSWQAAASAGPTEQWRQAPILHDPEYLTLAQVPVEEAERMISGLEGMLEKHPRNWFLRSAYGARLMQGPDPARGEALLRECLADTPGCPDAHLNLGTRLKWQGRRREAMSVFEDAVHRWPWHHQAVDSCMWLLTDDMVEPAS
ncbi:MAG: hypothetical protein WAO20_10165 [Acidobacteriota bacterium]